ncbi:MAG: sugar phosphate isomerase/epimerase [Clostridiales bacterium]|nr:sugar phosphate isomerase/epimerase [Clostridiales bacterium]
MRLGGSVMKPYNSPEEWLVHVKELGYSCVAFPVNSDAAPEVRKAYMQCIRDNDLLVGEVGVWKNLFSPDKAEADAAFAYSIRQLELAEEVGANCCVNISGSCGDYWDGYHPDNYSKETYERIVAVTQKLIDAVKPTHTTYSLEPMPWMHPDSPEDYLQMIKDVDRKAFSVHLDFANMINGVERYHNNAAFIRHCFQLLSPHIVSIHAKDVRMTPGDLPCSILEVQPGEGVIDLGEVTKLAEALGEDIPVFVEHLPDHESYMAAAAHMRKVATLAGVHVK